MQLIKNAKVLIAGELVQRDVLIDGQKIAQVAENITSAEAEVFEANGAFLTNGLVDVHVHFREPGFEYKETIATGSAAARPANHRRLFPAQLWHGAGRRPHRLWQDHHAALHAG